MSIINKLGISRAQISISQLVSEFRDGSLTDVVMVKGYNIQRPLVWSEAAKKHFVNNLIVGLPVPSLVILEGDNSESVYRFVLDGKQRLNAILDYMNNGFRLDLKTGQGDVFFNELPKPEQSEIKRLQVPVSFADRTKITDGNVAKLFYMLNTTAVYVDENHLKFVRSLID